MGGGLSKDAEREIARWMEPHEIQIDPDLREANLSALIDLGPKLRMCWQDMGVPEQKTVLRHYFITDMTHIIEFGQVNEGIRGGPCRVHSEFPLHYRTEKHFENNSDVKERIEEVVGATSFSIVFRNSEHMARYIAGAGWTSMMTVDGSPIHDMFKKQIADMHELQRQCFNRPPAELKKQHGRVKALYKHETAYIRHAKVLDSLMHNDVAKGFNVVVLGPTGCGKSRFINLMCNKDICKSAGGAKSVTQEMQLIQGKGHVMGRERLVNIVDTIGFCDTSMKPDDLHKLIKQYIKAHMMRIHKVVIVCAGRLEPSHAQAIREFLAWLKYSQNEGNFGLIYTKCEDLEPEQRYTSICTICKELGITTSYQRWWDNPTWQMPSSVMKNRDVKEQVSVVPYNISVGFPPSSPYSEIEDDFLAALDVVFTPPQEPMAVDMEAGICNIL